MGDGLLHPARREGAKDVAVADERDVAVGGEDLLEQAVERAWTSAGNSPPGQPSRHRYQSGRAARISFVVRPS